MSKINLEKLISDRFDGDYYFEISNDLEKLERKFYALVEVLQELIDNGTLSGKCLKG